MRILIAERSLLIADRLSRTLNELPRMKNITHATDLTSVLRCIDEHRPDVAIVDPDLAGSEGIELLKRIRRQQPLALLIVFSNSYNCAHRRRCLQAGADFFLDKSHDFDRLPLLIQKIHKHVGPSSLKASQQAVSPAASRRENAGLEALSLANRKIQSGSHRSENELEH
jgi:DNA-binding NarL/FixJ family response regulator